MRVWVSAPNRSFEPQAAATACSPRPAAGCGCSGLRAPALPGGGGGRRRFASRHHCGNRSTARPPRRLRSPPPEDPRQEASRPPHSPPADADPLRWRPQPTSKSRYQLSSFSCSTRPLSATTSLLKLSPIASCQLAPAVGMRRAVLVPPSVQEPSADGRRDDTTAAPGPLLWAVLLSRRLCGRDGNVGRARRGDGCHGDAVVVTRHPPPSCMRPYGLARRGVRWRETPRRPPGNACPNRREAPAGRSGAAPSSPRPPPSPPCATRGRPRGHPQRQQRRRRQRRRRRKMAAAASEQVCPRWGAGTGRRRRCTRRGEGESEVRAAARGELPEQLVEGALGRGRHFRGGCRGWFGARALRRGGRAGQRRAGLVPHVPHRLHRPDRGETARERLFRPVASAAREGRPWPQRAAGSAWGKQPEPAVCRGGTRHRPEPRRPARRRRIFWQRKILCFRNKVLWHFCTGM